MGLSALVAQPDGTFLSVVDNGFGRQDNSVDFMLRVYVLRPVKEDKGVEVLDYIQLSDRSAEYNPAPQLPYLPLRAVKHRRAT